jgi:hypothetical protein
MKNNKKQLSSSVSKDLLAVLKARFEKNMDRHKELAWAEVQAKLVANPEKLWSLNEMELTGGEPDVVEYDAGSNEFTFYDCAAESPKGRRSICYDEDALASRKEHKPKDSALHMAASMGVTILNEAEYKKLQQVGTFDTKTSSWVLTPVAIRQHGGALFCDRRYNHVFIYHNGAESYYASRGFRGLLSV